MNHSRLQRVVACLLIGALTFSVAPAAVWADDETIAPYADTEPTISGINIFANGLPLILAAGDSVSTNTVIYVDTNKNGEVDENDTIFNPLAPGGDNSVGGNDLSTYHIYGGCVGATITDGTAIMMTGGKVENIYGGGYYGTDMVAGGTSITITGGAVTNVYGGGSASGDTVTGGTSITMTGGKVANIYGGGYDSTVAGGTNVMISGGEVTDNIYGGGRYETATVNGNISLTIAESATVHTIFGGGSSGNVNGNVTVSITGGTVTGSVAGGASAAKVTGDTAVTVSGGAVTGNIYGGGNGGGGLESAMVVGNTNVLISEDAAVTGNVYGSGTGNIDKLAGSEFRDGNVSVTIAGTVSGNVCGAHHGEVTGNATIAITGTVGGSVYGHSTSENNVNGDVTVSVGGNAKITGAEKGIIMNSDTIFNGVRSFVISAPLTGGDDSIHVKFPEGYTPDAGTVLATGAVADDAAAIKLLGSGTTALTPRLLNDALILSTSPSTANDMKAIFANGIPLLLVAGQSDETKTVIYIDEDDDGAVSDGDSIYSTGFTDATIGGNDLSEYDIFGGSFDKIVNGDTKITMTGGQVRYIYGAGFGSTGSVAAVTGNTEVTATGTAVVLQDVYGGGMGSGSKVSGGTAVTISGNAHVFQGVYGGGRSTVGGDTAVLITDRAVIDGFVYGGADGEIKGSSSVRITGNPQIARDVYGGGKNSGGLVRGSSGVTLADSAAVSGSVYGGGQYSGVYGGTSVAIGGSAVVTGSVYGGGDTGEIGRSGSPAATSISITGGTVTGSVHGGGKNKIWGNTGASITGGTVTGDVYGGGATATGNVTGNAVITIQNARINGKVSGTGTNTSVSGSKTLTIGGDVAIGSDSSGIALSTLTDSCFAISPALSVNATLQIDNLTSVGSIFATGAAEGDAEKITFVGTVAALSGKMPGYSNGTLVVADAPSIISTSIYAKGLPLILAAGSSDATKTVIYVDRNNNGSADEGDFIVAGLPNNDTGGNDLSAFTVYGGNERNDLTGNTSIIMTGGKVKRLDAGNDSGTVIGDTAVTVTGGTVTDNIYGGGNGSGHKAYVTLSGAATIEGSVMFRPITAASRILTIGGGVTIGGGSDGIYISGGTRTTGTDSFAISAPLTGGAVQVSLPAGFDASGTPTLATGAVTGALDKLVLMDTGAFGLEMVLDGGTVKLRDTLTSSSVTLQTQDGTINAGDITSYREGVGATLPTNVTRTGYTFDGWYTAATGGTKVTAILSTDTGAKEYWAQWLANDTTKVNEDGAALTFAVIKADNAAENNVTGNLNLPATGSVHGSAIDWATSNSSVITTGGTVTRPARGEPDASVTLTAAITAGLERKNVNFVLTVKAATITVAEISAAIAEANTIDKIEALTALVEELTENGGSLPADVQSAYEGKLADAAAASAALNLCQSSPAADFAALETAVGSYHALTNSQKTLFDGETSVYTTLKADYDAVTPVMTAVDAIALPLTQEVVRAIHAAVLDRDALTGTQFTYFQTTAQRNTLDALISAAAAVTELESLIDAIGDDCTAANGHFYDTIDCDRQADHAAAIEAALDGWYSASPDTQALVSESKRQALFEQWNALVTALGSIVTDSHNGFTGRILAGISTADLTGLTNPTLSLTLGQATTVTMSNAPAGLTFAGGVDMKLQALADGGVTVPVPLADGGKLWMTLSLPGEYTELELYHVTGGSSDDTRIPFTVLTENGKSHALFSVTSFSDFLFYGVKTTTNGSVSSTGGGSTITVPKTDDGKVTIDTSNPTKGSEVVVTVTPDEGFELDELVITDKNGNILSYTDNGDGTYSFVYGGSGVTISGSFKPVDSGSPIDRFTDVASDAWYAPATAYVVGRNIMQGTSDTTFQPDLTLSRGMMAQILYNLEQTPASTAAGFADVPDGAWYAPAVNWVVEAGYMLGYDNRNFGPNDILTREQAALVLFRYAGGSAATPDFSAFSDAAEVSDWAAEAVAWAIELGVISGRTGNRLAPQAEISRAELAQMLMNFLTALEPIELPSL